MCILTEGISCIMVLRVTRESMILQISVGSCSHVYDSALSQLVGCRFSVFQISWN